MRKALSAEGPMRALLFLGALALCLFWPLFLGRAHLVPFHILAGDPALEGLDLSADRPDWRTYDLAPLTIFYAEKSLVAAGLRRGEMPLWNPCNGLGVPLLADGISQPLAPFFLPFLAAPNPWVYSLCMLAQLLFGGLGLDRFLKALSAGALARATGAVLFAFSPCALKYMAFDNVWAAMWFPWLFLCAERMATAHRGFWTMGGVVALTAASGHPEVAFIGSVAAWLYYLVRAWGLGDVSRSRILTVWPFVPPVTAIMLSAWWALPFLEWVHLSTSERMHVFRPIPYGWEAPFLWGSELLIPPLLLALALLGSLRHRAAVAMFPALLWSVLLLFPVPQTLQVALSLGFMSNRYGRSLAWFAVVILGALGLDALAKFKPSLAEAWGGLAIFAAWIGGAVAVAASMGGVGREFIGRVPLRGEPAAVSWSLWVLLALGISLWVATRWGGGAASRVAPLGMAACLAGGVLLAPPSLWAAWNRSVPKLAVPLDEPAAQPTGREWLPSMNGLQSLSPNLSAAFGVRDLRYVLPLTPKRILPLAQPLQWGFSGFYAPSEDILQFCGVARQWKVVATSGRARLGLQSRTLPGQIPRGFWVGEAIAVADAETGIRRALDGFAWRRKAFLEGLYHMEVPPVGPDSVEASVQLLEDRSNASAWRVDCPKPGWFVLRDLYWPGWRAKVDDSLVPIFPADGAFRAVKLGSGKHVVTFQYRPMSALIGFALTFCTLCLLGCMWASRKGALS